MSTRPTICVTVTPEPADFYNAGADESCVSIHLAFHVDDKATVQTLLKTPSWTFALYRLDPGGTSATAVPSSNIAVTQQWLANRDISGDAVAEWLDAREVFEDPPSFEIGQEVRPEHINTAGLLLGSISWAAPVPHAVQLMRVFRLKNVGGVATSRLFLLPVVIGSTDSLSVEPAIGAIEKIRLDVNAAGPFSGYSMVTNELKWSLADAGVTLPTNPGEAVAPGAFPVPVRKDGFLFSVRNEDDFRFLQTFERLASSLFWSLPPWLDLVRDSGEACRLFVLR